MEPEGIRIKLNLSEFFNDKRKYTYIFIERNKIKDFYDLESRIRDEFAITGNIIFLIDNVFVPHSESIRLLHEEETLTLSADTVGLNYMHTTCFQNSETKYVKGRKRKKHVSQAEDEREERSHDIVFVTEKKKKKLQSLKISNVSQNVPCSYSDACAIKQDIEIDDTCGLENEIICKENEAIDHSRYECKETPTLCKKKEKRVKNKPIISEEKTIDKKCETNSNIDLSQINFNTADEKKCFQVTDCIKQGQKTNSKLSGGFKENKKRKQEKETELQHAEDVTKVYENELIVKLNSETNFNENHEGKKVEELSKNGDFTNNRETNISDTGYNPMINFLQINEPISTDAGNVDSSVGRKRRRIRTRRRKKNDQLSMSEPQNTSDTCIEHNTLSGSIPGANHIRFSDEVSEEYVTDTTSVKGNSNENEYVKQKRVYMHSGDDNLNETLNSTHLRAATNQTQTKSAVCMSSMTTVTPVDTFNKLLSLRTHSSTPFVFNRASWNSNTFPEITPEKKLEQPLVIDSENEDSVIVEKYPLLNSSPKKDDIIAFKCYRMASDYTPHITDYIIATVLQYCADTSQITVKVQSGLDKLQEPQGRFSLFEDTEGSCYQNDTYEFNWNELMETRLLFP